MKEDNQTIYLGYYKYNHIIEAIGIFSDHGSYDVFLSCNSLPSHIKSYEGKKIYSVDNLDLAYDLFHDWVESKLNTYTESQAI